VARTLVLISAFNEKRNIRDIVAGIRRDFPGMDVVVVDDGSTDGTGQDARDAGAVVLSHIANMGYGVALQTGYKYAIKKKIYDYIVQMDGDGQHDYRDIPRLLGPLEDGRADIVIGSRFLGRGPLYRIPPVRRLGMRFFRMLFHLMTGEKVRDITSGQQAFKRAVLETYVADEFPYYYPDANTLILQLKKGVAIREVPTSISANREGKSMHRGLGRQIYYVLSMSLSILVIILKNWRKKNAG
jgi:glycosyltransferase involved in cell wall biosynthesis